MSSLGIDEPVPLPTGGGTGSICRMRRLIPDFAPADGAPDLAEYQQHQADDQNDPADGGDDGGDRQQIADRDEDDAEDDHRGLLGY